MPLPANVTHGLYARSPRALELRDRRVQRMARRLRLLCPWLEPSDAPQLRAFCQLEVLATRVYAVLTAEGVLTGQGDGKKLVAEYRQLRATQSGIASTLGLTPASRRAIKMRKGFDLAAEFSRIDNADETGTEA